MRRKTSSERSIFDLRFTILPIVMMAALTQPVWSQTNPVDDRLNALRVCLPETYRHDLNTLRMGLLWGWRGGTTMLPPPPPQYLVSLDEDVRVCTIATKVTDSAARNAIFSVIAKDIEIKTLDCRQFGMGRMVTVRVKTLLGGTAPDNGWQVFYKWVGASLLEVQEIPFPNLTSPATTEMPPGMYVIRVEKRSSPTLARGAPPLTIVVGSQQAKNVEIGVQ